MRKQNIDFAYLIADFRFSIGVKYNQVLLSVTDAATGMLSAMRSLQTLLPKMLHLTCFAHGLNRFAELIRGL